MHTITIDFETYYDKEYSLRNMTTREYILDARFQIIGVSVKVGTEVPRWFSGNLAAVRKWLEQFDFENAMVVAHNAIFDGAILEWRLKIKPKMYFCSMMASRPFDVPLMGRMGLAKLGEHRGFGLKGTEVTAAAAFRRTDFTEQHLKDYGKYCNQDVNLCHKLASAYMALMVRDEVRNLDLTIKKFTRPQLVLDANTIEDRLIKHKLEKVALLGQCGLASPEVLMSNDKFADALKCLGVSPPRKISLRTGKEAWAFAKTDKGMQELRKHTNKGVQLLVEARLGHKSTLEETRLSRFLATARLPGAWLSVPLIYWGAGTGRFSGADKLNLQNLPSRGEVGPALRKAIRAPRGYKVLACDFTAIELCMVAAFCGQPDLLEQLQNGEDSYSIFVSKLYNIEVEEVTEEQRFIGKLCLLSLQYGSGVDKFLDTMLNAGMIIDWAEADRTVKYYRRKMHAVVAMWRTLDKCIRAMARENCDIKLGCITFKQYRIELPNGTFMQYNRLTKDADGWKYWKGDKWVKIYGAMMLENISQALSRIVMTDAELVLADKGLMAAMSVHDELIYVPKEEHVGVYTRAIEHVMSKSPVWMPELPVSCKSNYGDSYYDAK